MKINKKKIVFASIIVIVLLFIVSYTMLVFNGEDAPASLEQPLVPKLMEEQEAYNSKKDALDAIKEERERSIPNIYPEDNLDSLDAYAPPLEEEQGWVVDTTVRYGIVDPSNRTSRYEEEEDREEFIEVKKTSAEEGLPLVDLAAGHSLFFLGAVTSEAFPKKMTNSSQGLRAEVNGTQILRTGDRLELILLQETNINGHFFPKNTLLYGFVSLQLNRVHIKITHLNGKQVALKAFDLQDSNEGIYVKNSFRAEAGKEVLNDVVQDINIAGLPQIGGIKNIFRKNNRNLKVTILDQYQLILKTKL